jgi:homoserine O-succinyltransferase/O-acetyltransferase
MPVRLDSRRFTYDRPEGATRAPRKRLSEPSHEPIRIGFVNSMLESAFKATESQFVSLLDASSEGIAIQLSLYVLPGISIPASNGDHIASNYVCVDELWNQELDGLIVTGTEPMTAALKDEPYWEKFTQLIDWARDHTRSAVWSCLAAHAAILHMDGIERRRNQAKHFGIFQCHRVSDDGLLKGTGPRFPIPHSRWNGVAEQELAAHGYRILTRTADAEVDTFIKQENSLFVFFQGHPEYATDTLLREYRRDIGRYLRNHAEAYPRVPHGYFDSAAEEALSSLRESANSLRSDQLLDGIAAVMDKIQIENTWQPTAMLMYRNWLEYICACKDASQPAGKVDAPRAACQ